ncbi:PRMT5 [Symbiodinium pilosum]|uniref:PRMT5 protein n=1 Tax=Symbiodinium pilosum TaxID=2952 RepID=A0A812MJE8_SYMPI|nr:PRMT5 [Symbiodinium pilosum]
MPRLDPSMVDIGHGNIEVYRLHKLQFDEDLQRNSQQQGLPTWRFDMEALEHMFWELEDLRAKHSELGRNFDHAVANLLSYGKTQNTSPGHLYAKCLPCFYSGLAEQSDDASVQELQAAAERLQLEVERLTAEAAEVPALKAQIVNAEAQAASGMAELQQQVERLRSEASQVSDLRSKLAQLQASPEELKGAAAEPLCCLFPFPVPSSRLR